MGRKKKFIDKKKSATFHLLARDTAAGNSFDGGQETDRVFVRVDNNSFPCPGFLGDEDYGHSSPEDDPYSIFADAPGDADDDNEVFLSGPLPLVGASSSRSDKGGQLPDHVRREILELGLPDDGYNYLIHLREIKNAGGGASYFENPKAKLDRLPLDVKAYDASKVRIDSEVRGDEDRDAVYAVASNTRAVKLQRALDPDVVRLLDDSDLSRFGSDDDEEFEEDFVIKANLADGDEEHVTKEEVEKKGEEHKDYDIDEEDDLVRGSPSQQQEQESDAPAEKPRTRRLLDEQFDLLTMREYDNDSDIDDGPFTDIDQQMLNNKLHEALKEFSFDELELQEKYSKPGDTKKDQQVKTKDMDLDESTEVIRRCAEYAEKYLNESQDEEEVFVEESSDESETWDCETIVSTYSNLDNHPGRIQAPQNPKKKLPRNLPGELSGSKSNIIALGGKDKLPVDYLPNKRRTMQKVKPSESLSNEKPKRRPLGEETKEEKKERKAAVKEEKREARRAKKELKGLYRCEAQRAQKTAAVSGPSSVRIM